MRPTLLTLALLLPLSISRFAIADEIILTGADANTPGLTLRDVTIIKSDETSLFFRQQGNEVSRPIDRVFKLSVTNDPALTASENAFVAGEFAKSVEGYQRAVRGGEDWKRRFAAPRLIIAAGNAGRFDAAVTGYLAFVRIDPSKAQQYKPQLPDLSSKFLDDAVKELNDASRSLPDVTQKQAVLSFLLDIYRARNDQAGINQTIETLLKLTPDAANDPSNRVLLADIRITQARVAIDRKQYEQVKSILAQAASTIVDPLQQANAMLLIAESTAATAKPSDQSQQLDAALAFMRVASHFADVSDPAIPARALLAAADIHVSLKLNAEARLLYQRVVEQYPDTTSAAAASKRLTQLN